MDTVEINNIIFFCHEKNGDCFVNKGYVKSIIEKFPEATFSYAHDHHPNIVQDLGCRVVRTFQIPSEVEKTQVAILHEDSKTLFVNTWIGAWIGKHLVPGQHGNFPLFHRAWSETLDMLDLSVDGEYDHYLPEIDYSQYDMTIAEQYLQKVGDKPLVIFCNGIQQSGQSSMGLLPNCIYQIAKKFSDHEFLVAHKLEVDLPNITYTDDLFGSKEGNLNQISYISRKSKILIGKNSGPFTYCHTKEMLNDPSKLFLSFNHRPSDYLLGEGEYYANSFFSSTTDESVAIQIIEYLLTKVDFDKTKKPLITIG